MLRTITKNWLLWLAMVALVALAFPAAAQDDDEDFDDEEEIEYSREGPYLGLSGMYLADLSTNNLRVSDTGGVELRIGFRLVPQMALELVGDWAHLGGRNPWSSSVAAKLYVMQILDEDNENMQVQPYVMSSAGFISGELGKSKDPSANFKVGAGVDYWLTSDLALVTQVAYNFSSGEATRWRTINVNFGVNWRY